MEKQINKLMRATAEQAHEYDELLNQAKAIGSSNYDELSKLQEKVLKMETSFDWSNSEFTDPETGKKGVKDVTGRILIPALYDEFHYIGSYVQGHTIPKAARKGELWGIVAGDGSGKELSDFRFKDLQWDVYIGRFLAWWDDSKKFGLVNKTGDVFIPNVLDCITMPWNDSVLLEGDGKYGMLDIRTGFFVLPEYDDVEPEGEENIVFIKDGIKGYVVEETGEFITVEQYENDDRCWDAYVYNTCIPF